MRQVDNGVIRRAGPSRNSAGAVYSDWSYVVVIGDGIEFVAPRVRCRQVENWGHAAVTPCTHVSGAIYCAFIGGGVTLTVQRERPCQ